MNTIYNKKPQKNTFDLSREVKMSMNMGKLYPCFIQDIIPGDSFKVSTQQLVRFSPLLAPMMHNIDFKVDYFFVPYRLVWDEWKDFITGGEDGDINADQIPDFPKVTLKQSNALRFTKGDLPDYLGIPPVVPFEVGEGTSFEDGYGSWSSIRAGIENTQAGQTQPGYAEEYPISALPFRAYQLIWHEYFRDQNVGDEYDQHTSSGVADADQEADILVMRNSNWQKDYFTSALPFLQRGGEVTLPLGQTAQVLYDDGGATNFINRNTGNELQNIQIADGRNFGTYLDGSLKWGTSSGHHNVNIDPSANLVVDLSSATSATINDLRKASAMQEWLELMARAGSRYREQIYAIFGERIKDYTVQVPQYLGGGKTKVMISEVLSTYQNNNNISGSTADRPVGDMYGHAIALGDNLGFTQSFDEHGIVLGLCRVIPKSSYTQGLNRFWQKFDKFDHYFPQFANMGEQEVYNKEIYASGTQATDNQIFGYQQRYAEYKYNESRIAGDFRDNLAHWELSRRFSSAPVLNQSFIECTHDDRIFAVTDETVDKIWVNLYHDVSAVRPIPYHSNPSLT